MTVLGNHIEELEQKIMSQATRIKELEGGIKSALESYELIRSVFRKHPDATEHLKIPLAIALSNQGELDNLLNKGQ